MTEIECFVCDATFESKTSHLKFIGKNAWTSLEESAVDKGQTPVALSFPPQDFVSDGQPLDQQNYEDNTPDPQT